MTTVIGIEGLVFASKTTLLNGLKNELYAHVIEEYGFYTKGSAAFPKYPPVSYKEAIQATRFFVKIEKLRFADFKQELKKKPRYIIVDRTYLTCLAFDYAARHFTGFDTFEEIVDLWGEAKKIKVDALFYLDVSNKTIGARVPLRQSKCPDHLLYPEFNGYIGEFFESYQYDYVYKVDANQDKKGVLQTVLDIIYKDFS